MLWLNAITFNTYKINFGRDDFTSLPCTVGAAGATPRRTQVCLSRAGKRITTATRARPPPPPRVNVPPPPTRPASYAAAANSLLAHLAKAKHVYVHVNSQ